MADSAKGSSGYCERNGRPMQRIGEVRRRMGVSRRSLQAGLKRHGCDLTFEAVKALDDPCLDVTLDLLWRIAEVLRAPITELLQDAEDDMPLDRRCFSTLLEIAEGILDSSGVETEVGRMARNLIDGLLGLMPDLATQHAEHEAARRARPPFEDEWYDCDDDQEEEEEE